jgi:hypothetical protein
LTPERAAIVNDMTVAVIDSLERNAFIVFLDLFVVVVVVRLLNELTFLQVLLNDC